MSERVVEVSPVTTADRTTKTYSLSLGRESPVSAILSAVNYIQSLVIESSSAKTISFSETREPLQLIEEIDVEEWKRSLLYNESAVDDLLRKILVDFELGPTNENMEWLKQQVGGLVSLYENKYNLHLPDATRSMVKSLIIRMAYDKLCIKNLA
jgi:hypothetical protein